jgi:hypothetical protein
MHFRAPRLDPLPYLGGPGTRKTRDGGQAIQGEAAKQSACVEVRAFEHVVYGLGVHTERAADTHGGQLSVVHQSIYRHLADPHQTGHFRDGEKLSTRRLAVGSARTGTVSLAARRITTRWPVHRRHRNPFSSGTSSSSSFPTAGTDPCLHEENSVAYGVTATGVG